MVICYFLQLKVHTFHEFKFIFLIIFTIVRWIAWYHLKEKCTQTVEISWKIVVLALENLGSHVLWWSADWKCKIIFLEVAFAHTKISNLEVTVHVNEDVFGLCKISNTFKSLYRTFFLWIYSMASKISQK